MWTQRRFLRTSCAVALIVAVGGWPVVADGVRTSGIVLIDADAHVTDVRMYTAGEKLIAVEYTLPDGSLASKAIEPGWADRVVVKEADETGAREVTVGDDALTGTRFRLIPSGYGDSEFELAGEGLAKPIRIILDDPAESISTNWWIVGVIAIIVSCSQLNQNAQSACLNSAPTVCGGGGNVASANYDGVCGEWTACHITCQPKNVIYDPGGGVGGPSNRGLTSPF